MPEIPTDHEAAQYVSIKEAIEPDWEEFERLAALPAVQEFCAYTSRYTDPWGLRDDEEWGGVFSFEPTAKPLHRMRRLVFLPIPTTSSRYLAKRL